MSAFSLADLEAIIAERTATGDASSWTRKLMDKGINKASQKLGEESVETVIAAIAEDDEALTGEAALKTGSEKMGLLTSISSEHV